MSRLFGLLAPVVLCASVVGCASDSDSASGATIVTDVPSVSTPVGSEVVAPATTDGSSVDTAPAASTSLDDLRELDAEGVVDALFEDLPPSADLTADQRVCLREELIELVESMGVDEFLDGVDTGVVGDPVPTALTEVAKRCGVQ